MTTKLWLHIIVLAALAASAGCGGGDNSGNSDTGTLTDAIVDVAMETDTGADTPAETDTQRDAGTDVVAEAGADVVAEAGADVVAEAGADVVAEAGADVVAEAGADVVAEAGADAVAEAGADTDVGAECLDGCLIDSECYLDGVPNPVNGCMFCNKANTAIDWSENDGVDCDDDLFCNGPDRCSAGTCSIHSGAGCVDDVACNGVESCDEVSNSCVDGLTPCLETQICDVENDTCVTPCNTCLIGDVCFAVGAPNPENACEWCAGDTPATSWSLNDGLACGHGVCHSGVCGCDPGYTGATCEICIQFVNGAAADDTGDGADWSTARKTLQSAINAAAPLGCQVWVAAGTYLPTTSTDRAVSFYLAGGVGVYGGFAGTETRFDQRDWTTNVTTLSGDIGIVDDQSDNSFHVVIGATGATLDGLTVARGMASGGFSDHLNDGAGMLNLGVSLTVSHCIFRDNNALSLGGGMSNQAGSTVTVTDSTFVDNRAGYGGGIHGDGSPSVVTRCSFRNNAATGLDNSQGGGMDNENGSNSIVTDSEFIGNYAPYSSAFNIFGSSPTLDNCLFLGNYGSGWGGGMVIYSGWPTITNCVFAQNSSHAGGGLYIYAGSHPTLNNCTFWGNTADPGFGDGLSCRSAVTINNSVFWEDTAFLGECSAVVNNTDLCGVEGTNGNICADPLFVSVTPTDATFLHLGPDSPCIDQAGVDAAAKDRLGNTAYDVGSVANASESARDMGAYEYRP